MSEIPIAIAAFAAIVLVLVLLILIARQLLVPQADFTIMVNGSKPVKGSPGQRLLQVFSTTGIHLPSACAGAGTCGLCRVRIVAGHFDPAPQEKALLTRTDIRNGIRLACQVPVIGNMEVEVDEAYFGVKTWQCTVERSANVASLIKEIVLKLPADDKMSFRPGSFVEITCPPYQLDFDHIEIDSVYRKTWDSMAIKSLHAGTQQPTSRAYSIANGPKDEGLICLNVRIALPPQGKKALPPGVVSSWLFSLKPGDTVEAKGPYGHFFVEPADNEIIFIGGGVGMAPLYAQILDLLDRQSSSRKISFWYGARSKQELYYEDVFDSLQGRFENFRWQVVLSEPTEQDEWEGLTGLVHTALFNQYLDHHPSPELCHYYLCGPPLMIKAVISMLDGLGVDAESIFYDDFGG